MKTETITWHELPADGMPDADMTVLVEARTPDDPTATEVWPGFWSGERWIDAGSGWPIDASRVVAWADQPAGTNIAPDLSDLTRRGAQAWAGVDPQSLREGGS